MKKSLLLPVAFLAFAGTAIAQDTPPPPVSDAGATTDTKYSVGVEAFYGLGMNDLYTGGTAEVIKEKANVMGANLTISAPLPVEFLPSQFALSYFGNLGYSKGSNTETPAEYYPVSIKSSLTYMQIALGLSLDYRPIEQVTISPRIRLGWAQEEFEYKASAGGMSITVSDKDMGLYYGLGLGAKYNINERHAIGIGIDYIAYTASPTLSDPTTGDTQGTKEQAYTTFSISYSYSF